MALPLLLACASPSIDLGEPAFDDSAPFGEDADDTGFDDADTDPLGCPLLAEREVELASDALVVYVAISACAGAPTVTATCSTPFVAFQGSLDADEGYLIVSVTVVPSSDAAGACAVSSDVGDAVIRVSYDAP